MTITPSREPHARDPTGKDWSLGPTRGPYQISLKAITFHVHSRGNGNKARNLLVKATVSFGDWPHEDDMSLPTWHPVPLPCKNN